MLSALLLLQTPLPQVFRSAFEDRPSMVLVRSGSDLWMAFNPRTGGLVKAWRGEVELRGKVFDFSQSTSRAKGTVIYAQDDQLLAAPKMRLTDVKAEGQTLTWTSNSGRVEVEVPPQRHSRTVHVLFEEAGRAHQVLVRAGSDEFTSTLHGSSDTGWQENLKEVQAGFDRLEFSLKPATGIGANQKSTAPKRIRNLRILAEPAVFLTKDSPLAVEWKGWRRINGQVELEFLVSGAQKLLIQPMAGPTLRIKGLNRDMNYILSGQSSAVKVERS